MDNIIKMTINELLKRRGFRFLIVGGINTVVGYGAFAFFVFFGLQYLIANTLATIIGVVNSYVWNRFFTFKSKNNAMNEMIRFASVYLISYCLGMLLLYVIVGYLKMNVYPAGVINMAVTTMISWLGHKNFSFKEAK
jgi:putative flippase GtrA